ncbi:glycerol-3-phosphate acyltransferase [Paenibacillus allorhizosphaerae]|uniref:Glycerol-3-phosphate acyltransferase n=1 Tax=Paenibacillus allorhizosphaerae TaxID=2849866 RepID=A0ABN7TPK9_9BACL|nr:glycerol-3-phosphate acyltransferase [Paenibacillus allorhizosphaerae]CAG7644936.1 Glycerol-3-phosphate acyltransferase [Paenibacillus allorhizosphaerae]
MGVNEPISQGVTGMIVLNYGWQLALVVLFSYFVGNFCAAIFISKKFIRQDIRGMGSKNAGTTNMTRVFGMKYGAATLLIDLLKGFACVLVSKWVLTSIGGPDAGMLAEYLAGLAVILGHNYPVLLGLRGGKGFASGIGVFIAVNPLFTFIVLLLGVIMLFIVDRMSVFALAFFAVEAIYYFIVHEHWWIPLFTGVYFILAVIAHWPNIIRLVRGEEKKLGLLRLIAKGR